MQVEISKQTTEILTVNVEPGYYRGKYLTESFYYLRQSGMIIYISGSLLAFNTPDRSSYINDIKDIVENFLPCEQSEFEAAKDKILFHLANYVSFPEMAAAVKPAVQDSVTHTMEPNNKQQEEVSNDVQQATEQAAATESAAQDTAMGVDAEEGSIEG